MEEKILIEGLCNRVKGAFVENGHAMLTNKRFIYSKHSLTKIAAMGVLVNLTKGDFDFEIKIEDIKEVSEAKRLFDKILVVSTMSGDEYKFFFTKLEEWKIHFNNLLSNTDNNQQSADSVSVADELMKFKTLLDSGAITQSEYDLQKKKILGLLKRPPYHVLSMIERFSFRQRVLRLLLAKSVYCRLNLCVVISGSFKAFLPVGAIAPVAP